MVIFTVINLLMATKDTGNVPLKLTITNLETETGTIYIGVYTPDNKFPSEDDRFRGYKFKPTDLILSTQITDLPYGTYAFALYQDVNENGKIDKNFLGIPTEPYAFSNNARPAFKAPSFDECCFEYNEKENTVEIEFIS
jgi:uncharacterized protein (DUF2141 family)